MGYDKGRAIEPCEFTSRCEAYDECSYTCSRSKKDCNTWALFNTNKIKEFRVDGVT